MPVIKSAIKRARQNEKRRGHNLTFKRELKEAVKSVSDAVRNNDKKDLDKKLRKAQSLLDKAVKKNLFHQNKAARKKAQLSRMVAGLLPQSTAKKPVAKKAPAKKTTKAKPAAKKTTPKKTPKSK